LVGTFSVQVFDFLIGIAGRTVQETADQVWIRLVANANDYPANFEPHRQQNLSSLLIVDLFTLNTSVPSDQVLDSIH
jgi:hypothetical protein